MWSKAGYNEYDFMRMKQDAIKQAKEMQHRAVPATASVNPSMDGWQNPQQQAPPSTPAQEQQRCPNCGSPMINGKHMNSANEQTKTGRGRGRPTGTPGQNTNHMQHKVPQAGSTAPKRPPAGRRNTNTRQTNPSAQGRQGSGNEPSNADAIGVTAPNQEHSDAPQAEKKSATQLFGKINIPILGDIDIDRDILLIGGLLLVLITEEGDRTLMLALLYIMMG